MLPSSSQNGSKLRKPLRVRQTCLGESSTIAFYLSFSISYSKQKDTLSILKALIARVKMCT